MKYTNIKIRYALIQWGGNVYGQRPRCALFKLYKVGKSTDADYLRRLTNPKAARIDYTTFKAARIDPNTGRELTKNLTTHFYSEVLHWFGHDCPDAAAVRRAKLALPKTPESGWTEDGGE